MMLALIMNVINWIIFFGFVACFSYQAVLFWAAYVKKKNEKTLTGGKAPLRNYAVLIAARNEEHVLPELFASIHRQTYMSELIDIYVVADNCTDGTARVSYAAGAYVYERFNKELVGKGYALQYLIKQMQEDGVFSQYDGFFIFDADNVLDKYYIEEMNKMFGGKYPVLTSYRNSRNFSDNWISSGYALWFLHEAQFLNRGRMEFGSSCMVSGTGYVVSREVLEQNNGWNFFLLTEDIEFTADCIVKGIPIGYCEKAVFYDEQPRKFKDSWHQRLRWVKGYFQVYQKYGKKLAGNAFGKNASSMGQQLQIVGKEQKVKTRKERVRSSFSNFDMLMANLPAFLLTSAAGISGIVMLLIGVATAQNISGVLYLIALFTIRLCAAMLVLGIFTVVTEWNLIQAPWYQKVAYMFTFPFYMLTYLPIAIVALKKNVEWKPIVHVGGALRDAA